MVFFSSCSFHSLHLNIKPYPHLPFPCRVVVNLLCSAGLILFPSCVQNMVYYKISHVDHRISNPEQRIASDIPKFCAELSDLVQDDLAAIAEGLIYIWRLCSYASPKYVLWILVILLWIDCYSLWIADDINTYFKIKLLLDLFFFFSLEKVCSYLTRFYSLYWVKLLISMHFTGICYRCWWYN